MSIAPFPHHYTVTLADDELSAEPRAPIHIGPPLQFNGSDDVWSPEHLLVAAVLSCVKTTFDAYARRKGLAIHAWRGTATGVLAKARPGPMFKWIDIDIEIATDSGDEARAQAVLEATERRLHYFAGHRGSRPRDGQSHYRSDSRRELALPGDALRLRQRGVELASSERMATNNTNPPTANRQRLLLADHHVAIETACADLRARVYGDDPLELVARYRAFERAITSHMQLEEELILPAYSEYDPADALTIREQHAELRRQLNRLGMDVELHCARAKALERCIALLRTHAAHEDRRMYPCAQRHLPLGTKRNLFVQVARSLRALARVRAAFASPTTATQPAQQPYANE